MTLKKLTIEPLRSIHAISTSIQLNFIPQPAQREKSLALGAGSMAPIGMMRRVAQHRVAPTIIIITTIIYYIV